MHSPFASKVVANLALELLPRLVRVSLAADVAVTLEDVALPEHPRVAFGAEHRLHLVAQALLRRAVFGNLRQVVHAIGIFRDAVELLLRPHAEAESVMLVERV